MEKLAAERADLIQILRRQFATARVVLTMPINLGGIGKLFHEAVGDVLGEEIVGDDVGKGIGRGILGAELPGETVVGLV